VRALEATPTTRPNGELKPWIEQLFSRLLPERRATLERFLRSLEARGLSPWTIKLYLQAIRTLGLDGRPYGDLTQEDLIEWQRKLPSMGNGGRLSDRTVDAYKSFVRSFLRWVHGGTAPECLKVLRRHRPKPKLGRGVLSPEEIHRLVNACESQRDRALIFVGYESGARAGELLSLSLRDIELDRYGAVAIVKGKTGERRIRLIQSVPDLQLWLNIHPLRDNADAPLWPSRWDKTKSITVTHFHRLLAKYAHAAGLNKRVHPHLLRHSRATHLATVLTEAQMREFFGWSKRSDMPEVYVHLSGRDVDRALLRHYGIATEADAPAETLKPVRCPRCGLENPAGFKYCGRCSMLLRIKPSVEVPEYHRGAEEIVTLFIREVLRQDPDLAERILKQSGIASVLAELSTRGGGSIS
jgi:integrase